MVLYTAGEPKPGSRKDRRRRAGEAQMGASTRVEARPDPPSPPVACGECGGPFLLCQGRHDPTEGQGDPNEHRLVTALRAAYLGTLLTGIPPSNATGASCSWNGARTARLPSWRGCRGSATWTRTRRISPDLGRRLHRSHLEQTWACTLNHRPRADRGGRSRVELYNEPRHRRADSIASAVEQVLGSLGVPGPAAGVLAGLVDTAITAASEEQAEGPVTVDFAGAVAGAFVTFERPDGERYEFALPPGIASAYACPSTGSKWCWSCRCSRTHALAGRTSICTSSCRDPRRAPDRSAAPAAHPHGLAAFKLPKFALSAQVYRPHRRGVRRGDATGNLYVRVNTTDNVRAGVRWGSTTISTNRLARRSSTPWSARRCWRSSPTNAARPWCAPMPWRPSRPCPTGASTR